MTNNEMWQQRERLVPTKWRPMIPLILVPIRKHSFAYFGNEITNDCPFCTSPISHLPPAFLSHFSFLTRCFLSHSLFGFPLPHSFATFRCQRRVTPTATAAAACHIKGLFYVTCCHRFSEATRAKFESWSCRS